MTNSKKKSYIKKIKPLYSPPTLARVPHTLLNALLHYTQRVDGLLLGDSSSHGRSLSACQLLSACLPACTFNLFRNFPQTSTNRVCAKVRLNPVSWLFAKFDDFRGTELKYTRRTRNTLKALRATNLSDGVCVCSRMRDLKRPFPARTSALKLGLENCFDQK